LANRGAEPGQQILLRANNLQTIVDSYNNAAIGPVQRKLPTIGNRKHRTPDPNNRAEQKYRNSRIKEKTTVRVDC